jgi:hypothetical protein
VQPQQPQHVVLPQQLKHVLIPAAAAAAAAAAASAAAVSGLMRGAVSVALVYYYFDDNPRQVLDRGRATLIVSTLMVRMRRLWGCKCVRVSQPVWVCFVCCGYLGERSPTGWQHTLQLGEPNCREAEALPHHMLVALHMH